MTLHQHIPPRMSWETSERLLSAAHGAYGVSYGLHPTRGSFEADVLEAFMDFAEEADPEERMSRAEDLVDAAARLRDQVDREMGEAQ